MSVGYTPGVIRPGMPTRGWFITLEGPEGAGKTTQAEALVAHLAARGVDVHLTREPGGTWLGERLREVLLARTDVGGPDRSGDRRAPVQRRPPAARDRGHPPGPRGRPIRALCPLSPTRRWLTRATARASRSTACGRSRLAATDGLRPDLTILLDLPVEAGLARVAPGDVTRFEAEFDLAFHRRVRDGFLALAAAEPDRFVVIDAARPARAVAAAVAAAADRLLGGGEPKRSTVRTSG